MNFVAVYADSVMTRGLNCLKFSKKRNSFNNLWLLWDARPMKVGLCIPESTQSDTAPSTKADVQSLIGGWQRVGAV